MNLLSLVDSLHQPARASMSSSMSSIGNQNIGVSPHVARIMNMVNTAERNSLGNLVCVCGDHALHSDHRNTWFAESTARIVPCADLENTQSVTYLTRTHTLLSDSMARGCPPSCHS